MPIAPGNAVKHNCGMKDWAIDYIRYVLDTLHWSANQLAAKSGVAASTISRPLREQDYPFHISRTTISKIAAATGIDPTPFIPDGLAEPVAAFVGPDTQAARTLRALDSPASPGAGQPTNEIKVAIVGSLAQIVATVNREGLARLRAKIDAIEAMLDD
jgi:transcriptional regulator with XRE-family HTH domain